MPKFDEDNQSDRVDDRRGAVPMSIGQQRRREATSDARWETAKGIARTKNSVGYNLTAPEGGLEDQAGLNSFAGGGGITPNYKNISSTGNADVTDYPTPNVTDYPTPNVTDYPTPNVMDYPTPDSQPVTTGNGDDTGNEHGYEEGGPVSEDDSEETAGAIPTSSSSDQDQDAGQESEETTPDEGQGATGANASAAPPGSAQSSGGRNAALNALIKMVWQHGMKQTLGEQAFAQGGAIRSFEDGGDPGDDQEGFLTTEPAGSSEQPQERQPEPAIPTTQEPPAEQSNEPEQAQQARDAAAQRLSRAGRHPAPASEPAAPAAETPALGADAEAAQQARDVAAQRLAKPIHSEAAKERMMNWLKGSNAASAQNLETAKKATDGTDSRAMVEAAGKTVTDRGGTPDEAMQAAMGIFQALRNRYDVTKSYTNAALDAGKMQTAIDAANKAFKDGPFDGSVQFMQSPDGKVAATVLGEDGKPTVYKLDGLGPLLKTPVGHYNSVIEKGVHATIQAAGGVPNYTPDTSNKYPGMKGPIPGGGYRQGGGYNFGGKEPSYAKEQLEGGVKVRQSAIPEEIRRQAQEMGLSGDKFTAFVERQLEGAGKERIAKSGQASREEINRLVREARQTQEETRGQYGLAKTGLNTETRRDIAHENNETKKDITQTQGENAQKRVETRVAAIDRATKAKLDAVRQQINARARGAEELAKSKALDSILRNVTVGMSVDDIANINEKLKPLGTSIDHLTQQTPAEAPQGAPGQSAPQGGAQSAPKGKPIGRDKNGNLVYGQ